MDTAELRTLFRSFAGEDRYRKFVRAIDGACHFKHRLLFWQQDLWQEFVQANPLATRSDAEVLAAFRVCYAHDYDLQPPPDNERLPEIRRTAESEHANETLFPFAQSRGFICPACRKARQKWINENDEICNPLRCKTTLEDFCQRHFGDLADAAELKEKARKRFAILEPDMQPGDELWERDEGGWHRLCGSAGIAIVRNGQMVTYVSLIRS